MIPDPNLDRYYNYNATSTVYKAKDTIAIYVVNGWSV